MFYSLLSFTKDFKWCDNIQSLCRTYVQQIHRCINCFTPEWIRQVLLMQQAFCHVNNGPNFSLGHSILLWSIGRFSCLFIPNSSQNALNAIELNSLLYPFSSFSVCNRFAIDLNFLNTSKTSDLTIRIEGQGKTSIPFLLNTHNQICQCSIIIHFYPVIFKHK